DGDGLVDCADPDCANAPECRHEICGNCIDDDGNGLVDGEDPACCGGAAAWMNVRRLMLKPGSATVTGRPVHGNRPRLTPRYTKATPNRFGPPPPHTAEHVTDGR